MAKTHGLDVVDVAWEDMSRFAFSSVGNNITDATLRVRGFSDRCSILRSPNFTDHTGDFNIGQFQVKAGNETGRQLSAMPLRDYLNGVFARAGGPEEAISADRAILVAPQTCVLPLDHGTCTFNMELFNYQTRAAYPAALAVVCTAEGTSAQVVTESGAQKLYFNRDGRACDFVAERLRHVRQREGRALDGAMDAAEEERNILLLFQVPLRVPAVSRRALGYGASMAALGSGDGFSSGYGYGGPAEPWSMASLGCAAPAPGTSVLRGMQTRSAPTASPPQGTDHAQLGVGPSHSRFAALPKRFELDPDAAIRCTVQHYLVTDEGSLRDADVAGVRHTMDAVYAQADRTGSLVVDADASTRSTAPRNGNRFWFFR